MFVNIVCRAMSNYEENVLLEQMVCETFAVDFFKDFKSDFLREVLRNDLINPFATLLQIPSCSHGSSLVRLEDL